jgi:hypothetical protein
MELTNTDFRKLKKKKKKEEKKGGEIFHFLAFSPQPNGFDFSLWPSKLTSVCKP